MSNAALHNLGRKRRADLMEIIFTDPLVHVTSPLHKDYERMCDLGLFEKQPSLFGHSRFVFTTRGYTELTRGRPKLRTLIALHPP